MIKNSQKQEVKIKQILQTKTAIMLKSVLLGWTEEGRLRWDLLLRCKGCGRKICLVSNILTDFA